MKLYATVSSERASKSQGGQEFVDVIVNDSKKENICQLYVEQREDEIYIEFLDFSSGEKHIFSKELPEELPEKGEKQKGEHRFDEDGQCKNCSINQ